MRKEKVKTKDFAKAMEKCPWAVSFEKVRDGIICYDSEAFSKK